MIRIFKVTLVLQYELTGTEVDIENGDPDFELLSLWFPRV